MTGRWRSCAVLALCTFIFCFLTGRIWPLPAKMAGVMSENTDSGNDSSDREAGNIHGELITGLETSLTLEQRESIFAYMERYYTALASLEAVELEDLFAHGSEESLALNRNAWEYLIGLRAMQKSNLKLNDYRYELTLEEIEEQKNGELLIRLNENSVQSFAQFPGIDSEFYHIHHTFVLMEEAGEWRIGEHIQDDGIYENMTNSFLDRETDAEAFYRARKEFLLEVAEEERQNREETGGNIQYPKAMHGYNREAAAAYAEYWVGRRNKVWNDFTGQGGNCQNFVSQCLYAGGIPRDISGGQLWSWKRTDSSMPENQENTLTWINVKEFRRYISDNRGYGLLAVADAPYLEGEIGDVIQMGFSGNWSHTVLISHVVTDGQGNTIDYLIDSNTADLKNFPVSAYSLPCQSLVKVCGWNE